MKPFSDEQLRAYFLGKLTAAESEIFEEECAADEQLTEQAQTVERELIDDFLRGNLSEADASLFTENYSITETRRGRISAAQNLWKIASETPPHGESPATEKSFWQNIFGAPKGFRLAFGGLLFLLIFGALAFYLPVFNAGEKDFAEVKVFDPAEKPETPQIQNTEIQSPNPVAEDSVVREKESDKTVTSPERNSTSTKTLPGQKSVKQNTSGYAAFLLFAGAVRGETEQSISIAPNVEKVNLLLNPSGVPNDYKIFRVVLKTAEDDTVYASPSLKSLNFSISSDKLENRTYVIFLEGKNKEGEFESIAEYTFRVRR